MNVLAYFHQLTSLNLSNNRIHKLDDLAELVTKVPHLKTLNLSNNEVKCLKLYLEQYTVFNFKVTRLLHFFSSFIYESESTPCPSK